MTNNNPSALDRLFPEPMSYHKGHVAKEVRQVQSGGGSPRLQRLTPKQKLAGIVRRRPEVIFKIGRANIKSVFHMQAAADYISRNGKIETEDQDGFVHLSKAQIRTVIEHWKFASQIPSTERPDDRRGHGRRIILSMPVGTNVEGFKKACRKWAHDCLKGHDYLLAFHTAENDKRTTQPHCHILVRTLGHDGKRLHIDNARRSEMREYFAVCLREQGIEANATQRWQRGVTRRSLEQPEFHNAQKVQSDKERARKHAIARKKQTKLLRTLQSRLDVVQQAAKSGHPITDSPGIVKAKKRRQTLNSLLQQTIDDLSEGTPGDRVLAEETRQYVSNLPPVESAVQQASRTLSDKAKNIQRMQAMKKRKALVR